MKKQGSFEFWRKKCTEASDELERVRKECMRLWRASEKKGRCTKKKREKPIGTTRTYRETEKREK